MATAIADSSFTHTFVLCSRKVNGFTVSLYNFLFLVAIPAIVTLIIFPVKFVAEYQPPSWTIGWNYGIAWVAAALLLTGSIMLCADRGEDEVKYRETTCYHNSIEEYCD